jgi:hypothetical protein
MVLYVWLFGGLMYKARVDVDTQSDVGRLVADDVFRWGGSTDELGCCKRPQCLNSRKNSFDAAFSKIRRFTYADNDAVR